MYFGVSLTLTLLFLGIRSVVPATHWPIGDETARDKDHSSIRGAKWWILHRHRINQLHNIPTSKFQKWFTGRQWRQFMSLRPLTVTRRSRYVNRQLIEAAIVGVKRAIIECDHQFRYERWNCSVLTKNEAGSIFGRLLLRGSPETAFVHAIISAGIVQSVAEACSKINYCPCNNRGRPKVGDRWKWEGCDHNVRFGKKFSRRMLDALEEGGHIRYRTTAHNNEAGRRNVVKNLEASCRCHGTSGSCSLKTCFRKTPTIRRIGDVLKKEYLRIVKVTQDNNIHHYSRTTSVNSLSSSQTTLARSNSWRTVNSRRRRNRNRNRNRKSRRRRRKTSLLRVDSRDPIPPRRTSLVYYQEIIPNFYCERRPEWNIPGTKGRVCNSTSGGTDNCRHLCCKRPYLTRHYNAVEQCQCKFVWCCKVECKSCQVTKKHETCM